MNNKQRKKKKKTNLSFLISNFNINIIPTTERMEHKNKRNRKFI